MKTLIIKGPAELAMVMPRSAVRVPDGAYTIEGGPFRKQKIEFKDGRLKAGRFEGSAIVWLSSLMQVEPSRLAAAVAKTPITLTAVGPDDTDDAAAPSSGPSSGSNMGMLAAVGAAAIALIALSRN